MKKVLEACIDQILQFDSEKEFEVFVEGLERKPHQFKVVNHYGLADGRHIARVKKQYNANKFMEKDGDKYE